MPPRKNLFGKPIDHEQFKKDAQIMIDAANESFEMKQLLEDLGKLKYLWEQKPQKLPHYHNDKRVTGKDLIDYIRKEVSNIKDLSDDEKLYLGGYLADLAPNYIGSLYYQGNLYELKKEKRQQKRSCMDGNCGKLNSVLENVCPNPNPRNTPGKFQRYRPRWSKVKKKLIELGYGRQDNLSKNQNSETPKTFLLVIKGDESTINKAIKTLINEDNDCKLVKSITIS